MTPHAITLEHLRKVLQPGDVLLYSGGGFFSSLIKLKTWSKITHCECYDGYGKSVASRDGIGVGRYDWRTEDLVAVLRPIGAFDVRKARRWFDTVDGQGYDWTGLLAFLGTAFQGKSGRTKQFCSEFLTRYLRAGGLQVFTPQFGQPYDADGIAPGEFLKSTDFTEFYRYVESAA